MQYNMIRYNFILMLPPFKLHDWTTAYNNIENGQFDYSECEFVDLVKK